MIDDTAHGSTSDSTANASVRVAGENAVHIYRLGCDSERSKRVKKSARNEMTRGKGPGSVVSTVPVSEIGIQIFECYCLQNRCRNTHQNNRTKCSENVLIVHVERRQSALEEEKAHE